MASDNATTATVNILEVLALLKSRHAPVENKVQAIESVIRSGNMEDIDEILKLKAAMKAKYTLLTTAAGEENAELVKYLLLKKELKVDSFDYNNMTALSKAAQSGSIDCMKILLKARADVNIAGGGKWTPALTQAVRFGREECFEALLKAGADVNEIDFRFRTALDTAVLTGHDRFIKPLIEAGADASSVIRKTISAGNIQRIRTLHKAGANMNSRFCGQTPLVQAVSEDKDACVQALMEMGADVNAVDNCQCTALIVAAANGNVNYVKLLINTGADVNVKEQMGLSALRKAASNGHIKCVKLLLEAGADVNATDSNGTTAFMDHSDQIGMPCTKLLLRAGAHVNLANSYGFNALQILILTSKPVHEEEAMLLFAAGDTIHVTYENGYKYFRTSSGVVYTIVPDYLPPTEFSLKHFCREAIRKHLQDLDPHSHMFGRVPKLGLPSLLTEYMLYGMSIDEDEGDDNDDDDS